MKKIADSAMFNAPDPVFSTGRDGRVTDFNPALAGVTGHSEAELSEMSLGDLLAPPPDADAAACLALLNEKGSFKGKLKFAAKSGELLDAVVEAVSSDSDGFIFFARDVTGQEKELEDLRAARDLFGLFLKHSPIYSFIKEVSSEASRVLYASENFIDMVGVSGSEMAGKTMEELFPPEFAAKITADDRAVVTEGKSITLDEELGGRKYTTYKFPIEHKGKTLLAGYTVDINERANIAEELKESEKRYRELYRSAVEQKELYSSLLESIPHPVALYSLSGETITVNASFTKTFGYTLDEIAGKRIPFVPPEESQRSYQEILKVVAGEACMGFETRRLTKDGSLKDILLSSSVYADHEGNPAGIVVILQDITSKKRAERLIFESEVRYRTLIELAADTILQGSPEGAIIGANESATLLTGYPLKELLGKNIAILFSESERARVPLRYDLLKQGKTVRNERIITRKDGTTVPVDMNTRMMPDGTYQTFMRDMSEQKLAEETLRASEEKFATVFRRAPVMMTLTSLDEGRFFDVNEKFCEVSGFSREELLGRTSAGVGWLKAEERERVLRKILEKGCMRDEEVTTTAKDGHRLHCLYSGDLVTIDGKPRVLGLAVDVTEKKLLEEELDKAQRLEALGVLAGGLAHDFNNILTGILGNVSLAQNLIDAGNGERAGQCLEKCEKAAIRASQLVSQLMTFARGGEPVKKLIAISPLIEESVSFALHGTKVRSEVEIAEGLMSLEADESQISQAINNLLINAVQAMPDGGTVRVRAETAHIAADNPQRLEPGPYVSISVRDSGTGIPDANMKRIFDPYFTTKERGTGLGLSTVYSIAKRHKGHVGVESEPGEGSVFTLLLPASLAEMAETHSYSTQPVGGGRGRILLMDDDPIIREVAELMLASLGYECVCVIDGEAAIKEALESRERGAPFAAAILDLTVPGGMGGREAAEKLQAMVPELKLLVSSGYFNDPVMADHKKYGFSGAIPKPYKFSTIAKELQALVSGR